jgi:hypothetical protein
MQEYLLGNTWVSFKFTETDSCPYFLFTFLLNSYLLFLFILNVLCKKKKSLLHMNYLLTFAPFAEEALRDNKNLGFF